MARKKAEILKVEEKDQEITYELVITAGDEKGEKVEIIQSTEGQEYTKDYEKGDKVFIEEVVSSEEAPDAEAVYLITDHIRTTPLIFLFAIFTIIVVAIGKMRGLGSMLGLVLSMIVLFAFTIPILINGGNVWIIGTISIIVILIPTMYLSHGFTPKSTVALISTFISLIIALLVGQLFIYITKLTGLGSEDAMMALGQADSDLNFQGILLLSLVIGAIGVIDDVTVSQVSSIQEIFRANPSISVQDLYKSSMEIGRDHIASMVNTLVLAYVGASLPLVMLFYISEASASEIINFEPISEEVVRTLVGSMALVLAVPLTSLIASMVITQPGKQDRWLKE